jgi:hypothetical protein
VAFLQGFHVFLLEKRGHLRGKSWSICGYNVVLMSVDRLLKNTPTFFHFFPIYFSELGLGSRLSRSVTFERPDG